MISGCVQSLTLSPFRDTIDTGILRAQAKKSGPSGPKRLKPGNVIQFKQPRAARVVARA